jgi:serine/threonine protein kinase
MGCSTSSATTVHSLSAGAETSEAVDDFHDKYLLGPKLGRGAFAQVRLATKVSRTAEKQPRERAVKILDLKDKVGGLSPQLQKTATTEASLWATIGDHPSCVRLYEVFFSNELCYMVMEKCAKSLYQHLVDMPEVNERTLGKMIAQMLTAIAHVHSVNIIHRDVKPDNFLIGGADAQTLKLTDFGLSSAVPSDGKLSGVYGTAPYMCPEMLKQQRYSAKADVWSLGALAHALLFGTFPYVPKEVKSSAMKQAIIDGGKVDTRRHPSPATIVARTFVETLLSRDQAERPTASEALNLTYMSTSMSDVAPEVSHSSLRPMVRLARKVGAFEVRDTHKASPIDALLNTLHNDKHGTPVPESRGAAADVAKIKVDNKDVSETGSHAEGSTTAGTSGTSESSGEKTSNSKCLYKGSGWSKDVSSQSSVL